MIIKIITEDDGIGFKLSSKRIKKGFGLFNLRERLEYLGGNLEIKSIAQKGTVVTIKVPLKSGEKTEKEILP